MVLSKTNIFWIDQFDSTGYHSIITPAQDVRGAYDKFPDFFRMGI